MKILLWHGYLLGGTESNVYTRELARVWSGAGHEVTVLCQEPHPEEFDIGCAKVVRPEIGPILPVFVLDRYKAAEPRLLQDCTAAERERVVQANAEALKAHLPGTSSLRITYCSGRPWEQRPARHSWSRRTAPSWNSPSGETKS